MLILQRSSVRQQPHIVLESPQGPYDALDSRRSQAGPAPGDQTRLHGRHHPSGAVDDAQLQHLAAQVAELVRDGKQVVLVTSGAIRAGRTRLGIHDRSLDLPARQAAAAVGQR